MDADQVRHVFNALSNFSKTANIQLFQMTFGDMRGFDHYHLFRDLGYCPTKFYRALDQAERQLFAEFMAEWIKLFKK